MLFELRQYTVRPDKQAEFAALMEQESIPFQVSKGMVIHASFVGEKDESVDVWPRRLTNEDERVERYRAVYESDHWRQAIAPRVTELIDREQIRVTRLVPTSKSVIQ